MADNDSPFRYVAEKLIEPAGANMWPLAVLWFDPNTRGLKVSLASTGAELVQGHGRKIGVIIESNAKAILRSQRQTQAKRMDLQKPREVEDNLRPTQPQSEGQGDPETIS